MACLGGAHFTLTQGAKRAAGPVHAWTLNDDNPITLSDDLRLRAKMHFVVLDQSPRRRGERFRVTTKGYMYEVLRRDGVELFSAHWHPVSRLSNYDGPHYHICAPALSTTGVFMERAHLPTHRVSFEEFIRICISQFGVSPAVPDWEQRLDATEQRFKEHRSWG